MIVSQERQVLLVQPPGHGDRVGGWMLPERRAGLDHRAGPGESHDRAGEGCTVGIDEFGCAS